MPALIFDCDGVLADTERFGHLVAFNQTFDEFGLPVHWTETDYAVKVLIGGGKERLASLLTPQFTAAAGLPSSADEQAELVAQWHKRKTEIYTALIASGALPARPGIERIVVEAAAQGYVLAVASTSAEPSVRAVLEHAVGPDRASTFHVFAGDLVTAKKPAPDIYLAALDELDLRPDEAVVIEDSNNGLRASLAAGINTIVTVSSFTADEDFTGASLVVSSLGDPTLGGFTVRADPAGIHPHDFVTIDDIDAVLAQAAPLHPRPRPKPAPPPEPAPEPARSTPGDTHGR